MFRFLLLITLLTNILNAFDYVANILTPREGFECTVSLQEVFNKIMSLFYRRAGLFVRAQDCHSTE